MVRTVTRESAEAKARRYLSEGRVVVQLVGPAGVLARVRGQGTEHRVSLTSAGWHCTCPAFRDCSHLLAVGLVTAPAPVRAPVSP